MERQVIEDVEFCGPGGARVFAHHTVNGAAYFANGRDNIRIRKEDIPKLREWLDGFKTEPDLGPAKNWACLHEIAGVCSIFELSAEERIAAVDALLARELESEEIREEFAKAAAAYADKVITAMNNHPELRLGEVIKQRLEEAHEQST